jgi:FkbM family methyltransferase
VRWLREFDSTLVEIQGHTFYAPALKPNAIVLDLGAATADFAAILAKRFGCRSYAAEALPDAYRLIPRDNGVTAFQVAISGTDGRMALVSRDEHHASASFSRFDGLSDKGRVEVDSVTLEGFLKLANVTGADLVKLDIEGAEFAMFDAARDETLAAIGQLTVEFHDFLDPSLEPACEAVIARLERLGFTALRFTRQYHGDMLFLNRRRLAISDRQIAWYKYIVRPIRGAGRILSRALATGSP